MASSAPAAAHRRIARLATLTAVHRAFHWLHLHQPQLRLWHLEMLTIPAPPFGETARARWFLTRFESLGLANVHLDAEGNALAELASAGDAGAPYVLISAHLDTVFPATVFQSGDGAFPREEGSRIFCPGACDNAAGLTALLAVAAALKFANIALPVPILFAANVGEEGEGDLRGMREIFLRGQYRDRIVAAIALEGSGSSTVVTRALASRRFRITVDGPGGHSWTDAERPNPILILSRAIARIGDISLPATPRTTISVGQVWGGTSINSIPEKAAALVDLRSTDGLQLEASEAEMRSILASMKTDSSLLPASFKEIEIAIEVIGNRPGGALPEDSPLVHSVGAADRHLALHTELKMGSTDANLPLSLGIPAVAVGSGGTGGGIHTLQEWYDPAGRETALRRIMLILLDTVQQALQPASAEEAPLGTLHQ